MHILSRQAFREAEQKFPNDRVAIKDTYKTLDKGEFKTPDELRVVFPSLDNFKYRDKWWVIDIGGNNLRLIACVEFVRQQLYVKHISTHAEYDKLCKRYCKE